MKKTRKLLALCLAAMMIVLAGCNGTPDPESAGGTSTGDLAAGGKGRYIETDVTPPDSMIYTLVRKGDGSLLGFNRDLSKQYESADGITWTAAEGPGAGNPELADAYYVTMTEDGTLYLGTIDWENNDSRIKKVAPDGTVSDAALKDYDASKAAGEGPNPQLLAALPGNRLLLSYYSGGGQMIVESGEEEESKVESSLQEGDASDEGEPEGETNEEASSADENGNMTVFDSSYRTYCGVIDLATGETLYELTDADMLMGVEAVGDLMYCSYYDGAISIKNVEDGREVKKIAAPVSSQENMYMSMGALGVAADGTLYTADSNGLFKINEDGARETIFQGQAYQIGRTTSYIMNMTPLADGSFLMAVSSVDTIKLYRYHYDENASYDPAKSLTVWALKESGSLRNIISDYTAAHPDSEVNLVIGRSGEGAQDDADIIRTLNTQILAGEGPDLIMLDGLPLESYASRGLLADLTDLVDTSDVHPELLSALKLQEGLFFLPGGFNLSFVMGDKEVLKNVTDLESLVKQIETGPGRPVYNGNDEEYFSALSKDKQPTMSISDFEELYSLMWQSHCMAIMKNSQLDTDALRSMMEATKRVSDKYEIFKEEDGGGMVMASGVDSEEMIAGSAMDYMNGRSRLGALITGAITNLRMIEKEDSAYMIFPGLEEGAFTPLCLMGISAKSENQETAKVFMQEILSENTQGSLSGGFAVTKTGTENQSRNLEVLLEKALKENGMDSVTELGMVETATFDLDTFIKGLQYPVYQDEFVREIIGEATQEYCTGSTTLDQAVSQVDGALKNYLAERSQ